MPRPGLRITRRRKLPCNPQPLAKASLASAMSAGQGQAAAVRFRISSSIRIADATARAAARLPSYLPQSESLGTAATARRRAPARHPAKSGPQPGFTQAQWHRSKVWRTGQGAGSQVTSHTPRPRPGQQPGPAVHASPLMQHSEAGAQTQVLAPRRPGTCGFARCGAGRVALTGTAARTRRGRGR